MAQTLSSPIARRVVVATLCLLALTAPVVADVPEFELTQTEVPKDDIPLYFVVMHFFESTAHYRSEMPYQYETRLVDLGLEPGGAAEDVLADALDAASEILQRQTVDTSLQGSEDEFMAFQERALEAKARDLAAVYGGLLADLETTGVTADGFHAAVDRTVRSKVSLYVEILPGEDPLNALVAESTIQSVLPFETWFREVYEARGSSAAAVGVD